MPAPQEYAIGTWARSTGPYSRSGKLGNLRVGSARSCPREHSPHPPGWRAPVRMSLKCLKLGFCRVSPSTQGSIWNSLSKVCGDWSLSFKYPSWLHSLLPSWQLDEGRRVLCDICLHPRISRSVLAPGHLFMNYSTCSRVFRSEFGLLKRSYCSWAKINEIILVRKNKNRPIRTTSWMEEFANLCPTAFSILYSYTGGQIWK